MKRLAIALAVILAAVGITGAAGAKGHHHHMSILWVTTPLLVPANSQFGMTNPLGIDGQYDIMRWTFAPEAMTTGGEIFLLSNAPPPGSTAVQLLRSGTMRDHAVLGNDPSVNSNYTLTGAGSAAGGAYDLFQVPPNPWIVDYNQPVHISDGESPIWFYDQVQSFPAPKGGTINVQVDIW